MISKKSLSIKMKLTHFRMIQKGKKQPNFIRMVMRFVTLDTINDLISQIVIYSDEGSIG